MWEIVLGAFVVIGIFVFWCDVTDAWNNVFRRNKYWKTLIRAFCLIQSSPLPTRELRFNIRGGGDAAPRLYRPCHAVASHKGTEPIEGFAQYRPLLMRRFT
jgi:hypothetical protein